ncbi:hypothetical protein AT15_01010 [Kosmotoga arenicorallina S304]|uniref:Uncharacterized protein n=1 Tax=Kosmotoga arenicorallina S304 TaxID=1453497 RepID=A0A176K144_9BACT|nr:hypothetical protein [Kosmotoga arenicorallina]OAA30126.1 hypothetical protein AT15_01010 [Kosmotoga arenicorallina S304]
MNIKRVLVTVSDRENLLELCNFLSANGAEIVSDTMNYNYLIESGIDALRLKDFFDGTHSDSEMLYLTASQMNHGKGANPGFDMVITNFNRDFDLEYESGLSIDAGKLALVSASIRNYRDIVLLTDPGDYEDAIDNMTYCGDILLQKRRRLALKGLYSISSYISTAHKEFSQLFASEKYEYLVLEYVIPTFSGGSLYKIEGYPGLLDEVHLANPSVGIEAEDVNNAAAFMKLYDLLGDVSAFLTNGKVLHASVNGHIKRHYSSHGMMYASSFTIDYPIMRRLSALGVGTFCGVFNGEAVRFAHENDIKIFTIPDRSVVNRAKELFYSSENYLVKEANKELNLNEFSRDEKLAVATAMVNPPVSGVLCDQGEARALNTGIVSELITIIKGIKYNSGSLLALNVDPVEDEYLKLKSMKFKTIMIPGIKKDYTDSILRTFLK